MVGNANNYDYLFKYIIVGDSSTSTAIKVLASLASSCDTPKTISRMNMSPPSE